MPGPRALKLRQNLRVDYPPLSANVPTAFHKNASALVIVLHGSGGDGLGMEVGTHKRTRRHNENAGNFSASTEN
jgi:hypothetical protein